MAEAEVVEVYEEPVGIFLWSFEARSVYFNVKIRGVDWLGPGTYEDFEGEI